MRGVAAVLCSVWVIAGSGCRPAPSGEAGAAQSRAEASLGPRLQPLFASIERNPLRPALVGMVAFDMRVFRAAIERGAAIGGDHLDQLTRLGGAQADAWLRTPAEKRVFVAASGSDGPTDWQLTQTLKADGYESYIYDFCQGQGAWTGCPSEIVGAYLGTAGHALVGVSDEQVRKHFVLDAANAAPFSVDEVRRTILITPTQASTIGAATPGDFVAAEIEARIAARAGGGR